MVFVKCVYSNEFKEELLFCFFFETTAKAVKFFKNVSSFFESENHFVGKRMWMLHRQSPATLGTKSGFQDNVKKRSSNVKSLCCIIHCHALASKTLPAVGIEFPYCCRVSTAIHLTPQNKCILITNTTLKTRILI